MKAIVYHSYGSPDNLRLTEEPQPVPKDNEVLVKVHAASINSWDWDLVKGEPFLVRVIGGLRHPKNKILGADIAGVVSAVGKDVKDFSIGDEVFGDIAGSGFGGFAGYVSVPAKLLAPKSPAMTFEQSAAMPQAGLLALQGLRYKRPAQQGQQVLINGAGGAVGTLALQYLKSIGAEVTCVDSTDKLDMLRTMGADHVIDYTREDYTGTGKQYDYILDVIAHRKMGDYKAALKTGGVFSMIGGSMKGLLLRMMLSGMKPYTSTGKNLGIMGYRVDRKGLEELNSLFEEGKMTPVIDRVYPLSDVPDAFRYFGSGRVKGKIIIRVL